MTSDTPAQVRVMDRICQEIRDQIASGALPPGARVPSTRALAAEWGASRTTVTAAYGQLIAEGYLEARHGAATRVGRGLASWPPKPKKPPLTVGLPDELSAYGRRLADFVIVSER